MFSRGDQAVVLKKIISRSGYFKALPGDIVEVTEVYNCQDGETQIIGVAKDGFRVSDIVLSVDPALRALSRVCVGR